MQQGIVPPTINLDNPDLEAGCDLDYTPNVAYKFPEGAGPRAIVSDNLGFGKFRSGFEYIYSDIFIYSDILLCFYTCTVSFTYSLTY